MLASMILVSYHQSHNTPYNIKVIGIDLLTCFENEITKPFGRVITLQPNTASPDLFPVVVCIIPIYIICFV